MIDVDSVRLYIRCQTCKGIGSVPGSCNLQECAHEPGNVDCAARESLICPECKGERFTIFRYDHVVVDGEYKVL